VTVRTPTRLGLYGLGLAVVFASALGVGRLAGPQVDASPQPAGHRDAVTQGPQDADELEAIPGGLQVGDRGYRLVPQDRGLPVGVRSDFRFRIVGPDGTPVTAYTPTHEKDLHLIVVRRDLSGFQHLHPDRAADGTWSTPLAVAEAGQYRVFADFQPAGLDEPVTLGVDVPAAGMYRPRPLPAPARTAEVDGYRVELAGELVPGTASKLTVRIARDGIPVTDLQPYLGAFGHLVALRDGDLAYLHVHPDGAPAKAGAVGGPGIAFHAEVPTPGRYRLYLQFQHDGAVHTAEFTAAAGDAVAASTQPPKPAETSAGGHDDQPHGHG
jgi:hypothetical protein